MLSSFDVVDISPRKFFMQGVSPRKRKALPTKNSQISTPRENSKNLRAKCLPVKTKIYSPQKLPKGSISLRKYFAQGVSPQKWKSTPCGKISIHYNWHVVDNSSSFHPGVVDKSSLSLQSTPRLRKLLLLYLTCRQRELLFPSASFILLDASSTKTPSTLLDIDILKNNFVRHYISLRK